MSSSDVRKGVSQARFNEEQAKLVFVEIGLIAATLGFYYRSWYVFGSTLIGLIAAMSIQKLNIILALGLSVTWGGIGFGMGKFFSNQASYVLCVLGFLLGIGVHFAAIEWTRDVSDPVDRNF